MTTKFQSLPQRAARNHDPHWTADIIAGHHRTVTTAELERNRAAIAALEKRVLAGEIKPIVVPMGRRQWRP